MRLLAIALAVAFSTAAQAQVPESTQIHEDPTYYRAQSLMYCRLGRPFDFQRCVQTQHREFQRAELQSEHYDALHARALTEFCTLSARYQSTQALSEGTRSVFTSEVTDFALVNQCYAMARVPAVWDALGSAPRDANGQITIATVLRVFQMGPQGLVAPQSLTEPSSAYEWPGVGNLDSVEPEQRERVERYMAESREAAERVRRASPQ